MSLYVCHCTNVVYMLCVHCIYIYVNKFEARSLFSTSNLKNKCRSTSLLNFPTRGAVFIVPCDYMNLLHIGYLDQKLW